MLDILEPNVGANLSQYITVKVSQTVEYWSFDNAVGGFPVQVLEESIVPMVPCGNKRLGLTPNSTDYEGLSAFYLCPQKVDFNVSGSKASSYMQYIDIQVRNCN